MRTILLALLFTLSTGAFAKSFEFEIAAGKKLIVKTHEDSDQVLIDFTLAGKPTQTEKRIGDALVALDYNGKSQSVQAIDLDGDGTKEILVRALYIPIGVVRVFKFDAATGKFSRLKFGRKKEDGVPVPPRAIVQVRTDGTLQFAGGLGKKPQRMEIPWKNGQYVFPARPAK